MNRLNMAYRPPNSAVCFVPDSFYLMPLWSENEVEQEYRSLYIIAGIDAIIRVWVTRGFQESVEEIVEIVKRAQDRQIPMNSIG